MTTPLLIFNAMPPTAQAVVAAAVVTVFGAVLSAFLSLLGVSLTNRAAERRFRMQVEADVVMNRTDREMNLRKEIYLSVAEAIHTAIVTINRFTDLDIPAKDLMHMFDDKHYGPSKAHLVGSSEMVASLLRFSQHFTASCLELSIKRKPLIALKAQIEAQKRIELESQNDISRSIEEMKAINKSASPDPQRWEALESMYRFAQGRSLECVNSLATLESSLQSESLQFGLLCARLAQELEHDAIPIVKAAREELQLPFNATAYEESFKGSAEAQVKLLEATFANVANKDG